MNYKTILVAIDFSAAADTVIERACELAAHYSATLTLLHVVEYLPPLDIGYEQMPMADWGIDEDALVEASEKRLATIVAEANDHVPMITRVTIGMPKHEIIQVAQEIGAELLIIGSHGRHGFSRLLGSTAGPVLHNAPCDVLAVRVAE